MLVGTRNQVGLRSLWIPAIFLSLPFTIILSECLSGKKGHAADALLRDTAKALVSWLSRPSIPRRISFRWLFQSFTQVRVPGYQTYGTVEEEGRYWKKSERLHAQLLRSDGWYTNTVAMANGQRHHEKPIVYFTPQLPPLSQKMRTERSSMENSWISAKVILKWHWLVFPDRVRC